MSENKPTREPSKEAMNAAGEIRSRAFSPMGISKDQLALVIDREFAALRAKAEAADALASALVAIKTEHANYTSVHGSDEDDEQAVALADAALAAYEAKEVK